MSRSKIIVQSLDSALAWADRYPESVGFKVAPLSSLGGARNWHVVDFGSSRWVRDDEAQAAWVPLDSRTEILPSLPPSKISRWAFAFIAERGTLYKPELTIWPGAKTADEPPPGPPRTVYPENELVAILLEGLRDANAHTRACLEQLGANLSAAHSEMIKTLTVAREEVQRLGESRMREFTFLSEHYRALADHWKADLEKIKQERDDYYAKYMQAQELLLMERYKSQSHTLIREIFGGKPELFIKTLSDLMESIRKWTQHGATDPKPSGSAASARRDSEEPHGGDEAPQLGLPLGQGQASRQAG